VVTYIIEYFVPTGGFATFLVSNYFHYQLKVFTILSSVWMLQCL